MAVLGVLFVVVLVVPLVVVPLVLFVGVVLNAG